MPRLVVPEVATAANRPSSPLFGDGGFQVLAGQPPVCVGLDLEHVDVHHLGGRVDGGVRFVCGGDAQPRRPLAAALGQVGVAGGDQRREIADRSAGDEAAAGLFGHTGQVGDPAQRLVLGVHRPGALQPAAAVDRRGADDQVEQRGGLRRSRRDERQVARVVDRHARIGEHFVEDPQRLGPAQALLGHCGADRSGQLGGCARTVQRYRVQPQPIARVGQDRLCQSLGHVGVAMHGGGVDHPRSFPDADHNRAVWVQRRAGCRTCDGRLSQLEEGDCPPTNEKHGSSTCSTAHREAVRGLPDGAATLSSPTTSPPRRSWWRGGGWTTSPPSRCRG